MLLESPVASMTLSAPLASFIDARTLLALFFFLFPSYCPRHKLLFVPLSATYCKLIAHLSITRKKEAFHSHTL